MTTDADLEARQRVRDEQSERDRLTAEAMLARGEIDDHFVRCDLVGHLDNPDKLLGDDSVPTTSKEE